MPLMSPISRKDLIYYLKKCGIMGPFAGKKHEIMSKNKLDIRILNPHQGDISIDLLKRLLKEAGIEKSEWEAL